jgi:8-oxo-dGTP pyrophosphatase MutT (NUDIX family)
MTRVEMVEMLKAYTPDDEGEREMLGRMIEFARSREDCCQRSLPVGHMTGSAWVVDRDKRHALMTHHRKLNRWLQMGGHADGSPDLLAVALREAREESGLVGLRVLSETPFDVDVHLIPERGAEAAHFHYDVRFLLEADRGESLVVSEESHALAWIPLGELSGSGESILRMVRKTQAF